MRIPLVVILTIQLPRIAWGACVGLGGGTPLVEEFSQPLGDLWAYTATCGSGTVAGGELVLTKNAGCTGSSLVSFPAPGDAICGDFIIEVDYDISSWPASSSSGGRYNPLLVRDTSGNLLAGIERYRENANICIPFVDSYKAYTTVPGCQDVAVYVSTGDLTGSFRLERVGGTVRAYYGSTSGWVQMMQRSISTVDVVVNLNTGTNGSLTSGHTSSFDNFRVYAQGVTSAPGDVAWLAWGRVKASYREVPPPSR